mmetsp:Transcript_162270/g.299248  ORF Transcript_162270/g.299248 Transcript_162270/m.299248 type:complete len:133 (+) Transcript_162270:86-484(+)
MSDSESGTPDWLRKRREKVDKGEVRGAPESRDRDRGDSGGKSGGKGGGKNEKRPGDWECPSCGTNNFARRTECFKCGTPKGRENGSRGGGGGGRRRSRSRSRRRSRSRSRRRSRSRDRDRDRSRSRSRDRRR